MKNKMISFGIIVSAILGLVCYVVTINLYLSLAVIAITLLYFVIIVARRYQKMKIKINRFHECYNFINNFIISLSIKGSLLSAYENSSNASSDEFLEYTSSISELDVNEKIVYLYRYFRFHVYKLFTDLITLWSNEGGNIIEMSTYLTNQIREIEEYITFCESVSRGVLSQFSILWLFSLAIIVVLKFSLSDFYAIFLQKPIFIISIFAFFMLIIISVDIFLSKMGNIEIGGWSDEEK